MQMGTRGMWLWWVLVVGCAARPAPELAWTFEARPTSGEVRVLPLVALHEPPPLDRATFVGGDLSWQREAVRRERTHQLDLVPEALALGLPGAINGALGLAWPGQLRVGDWPYLGEEQVRAALGSLDGPRRLDAALGRVARRTGADATLFTWVDRLEGRPLSADGFPGVVVETPAGPVLVDHADEPYLVRAGIGVALVAADGEVVLRYHDTYEAVLSGRDGPERAARDLARSMADELGKVWAIDPRLAEAAVVRRSDGDP